MASPPDVTRSHSASGESTPPGRWQLIATMAMGSSSAAACCSCGAAACDPSSSLCRKRASAVALGWSKTSVGGSARPVAVLTLLRSSTAVRESKPRSLKARSGSTSADEEWPRTAATCARTRSVRV